MGDTFAKDVFEIATMFIGAAILALLVSHAQSAGSLISTTSNAFGGLLKDVTLSDNTVTNAFTGG